MYPIRSDKNTHVTTDQVTTFSVFENLPKSRIQHFNIASEASYVYILSRQKIIENAQNGPSWQLFCKPEACGQTVLPQVNFK